LGGVHFSFCLPDFQLTRAGTAAVLSINFHLNDFDLHALPFLRKNHRFPSMGNFSGWECFGGLVHALPITPICNKLQQAP
jgi:hypothetical protein